MTPQRHFFDWSHPLAPQAARWLLARAQTEACIDLSTWAVIVPTAEAGRRLSAALLRETPHAGMLSPRLFTPVQFLNTAAIDDALIASREERLLVWCAVLQECDPNSLPALFPAPPESKDFFWAKGTARLLLKTQELLIENGQTLTTVSENLSHHLEPERWENLAHLEKEWSRLLEKTGRRDPAHSWRKLLDQPRLPEGLRHVALLGTPDPIPALIRCLEKLSQPEACDIGLHAPASEAAHFDSWGRPDPDQWPERKFLDSTIENFIQLSLSEEAQAQQAAALAMCQPDPRAVVVGLGREEMTSLLETELREQNLKPYDPAGLPALRFSLWALLDSLQRLMAVGRYTDLLSWIHHPGTQRWLQTRTPHLSYDALFLALDRFAKTHLPQRWTDLRDIPAQKEKDRPLLNALTTAVGELLKNLSGPKWLNNLRDFLSLATETPTPADTQCAEIVRAWIEAQETFRLPGPSLQPADYLGVFLEEFASLRLPGEHAENIIELNGWLELGWDERPHLILTGFQEGGVPRSVQGDVFVPESLRERLGLRTNRQRFACDAFQLQALIEQRRAHGRVDLLLSKFSAGGDPLRPSRLLFLCPDDTLAHRVHQVFQAPASNERLAAPTQAFQLQLPPHPLALKKISVTQFRDYLESPFLFYLRRHARWEEFDGEKQELDPLDFGSIAHAVLEAMGRDLVLRHCTDPSRLRTFLQENLEEETVRVYGQHRPLAADIQIEALRHRLERFAELQAAEVAQGWIIETVEHEFEFPLDGWIIKGKIDRIDRHPDGRVRLLDYKTSDKTESPEKAHLKILRTEPDPARFPAPAFTTWAGKNAVWKNLQLPLYVHHWNEQHPDTREKIRCGYIQLPQAVQETAFTLWDNFDTHIETAAVTCARQVLKAMDDGHFWPPLDASVWKSETWNFWLPGGPETVVREIVL